MNNAQNHHTYSQPSDPRFAGYFGRTAIGPKPGISNMEFKTLLECIDAGDASGLQEALDSFSFDPTQKNLLQARNAWA